jgi:amino acid permease
MIFFGISAFSYAAHCEVVAVEADAISPQIFARVLPISLAIVFLLYILVSFFAFACFGPLTHPNILLNLGSSIVVDIIKVAFSFCLIVNYSMAIFPASQAIDLIVLGPHTTTLQPLHSPSPSPVVSLTDIKSISRSFLSGSSLTLTYEQKGNILRFLSALFTFSFALFVRDLGVLFSLVGSFFGGLMCFFLPPLFYMKLSQLERYEGSFSNEIMPRYNFFIRRESFKYIVHLFAFDSLKRMPRFTSFLMIFQLISGVALITMGALVVLYA